MAHILQHQNKYAKNIRIEGGVVTARGGKDCAGLGGGRATPVDGIYITEGISSDAGGADMNDPESMNASNIEITGGNTLVIAVGDKDTAMPGIGCGRKYDTKVRGTAVNITTEPDAGYQDIFRMAFLRQSIILQQNLRSRQSRILRWINILPWFILFVPG